MPFRLGIKLTEEHKAKLKVAQKRRFAEGRNPTAFKKGHIPTLEMRAKMGKKWEWMIKEIKKLLETEFKKEFQLVNNGEIAINKSNIDFIRYLQDQVNKITGGLNES